MAKAPGATVSQISRETKIPWATVRRILNDVFVSSSCTCGRRFGHKGICPTRSKDINYRMKSEVVATAVKIDEEHHSPSTGKCVEVACPYPVKKKGYCGKHYEEFCKGYSLLSSTLAPSILFRFPERHRSPKRHGCL